MIDNQKAYIAGFLDGDGSVMLQFKPRKKVSYGFRVKTTICFYQKTRCNKGLVWIKEKLGAGYLYQRPDDITELRIEGHQQVKSVLVKLSPYIVFKREQVKLILKAIEILQKKPLINEFLEVCRISDKISNINYATVKKKYTFEFVKKELVKKGLIPP